MLDSMSLTKQDLAAIRQVINVADEALERRLTAWMNKELTTRLDRLDDILAIQTQFKLSYARGMIH